MLWWDSYLYSKSDQMQLPLPAAARKSIVVEVCIITTHLLPLLNHLKTNFSISIPDHHHHKLCPHWYIVVWKHFIRNVLLIGWCFCSAVSFVPSLYPCSMPTYSAVAVAFAVTTHIEWQRHHSAQIRPFELSIWFWKIRKCRASWSWGYYEELKYMTDWHTCPMP